MPEPSKMPTPLFTELGRVVVIWAYIEQDILTHTSAMGSQKTDGYPRDFPRLDFRRLRETWYRLCREYIDTKTFNKTVHPLNTEIVRLAPFRHHAIHGTWRVLGRGKYHLSIWEQKTSLERLESPYSLSELRGLVVESFNLARRIRKFTHAADGAERSLDALVPEEVALIPMN
jgi:hypothetical protein